MTDANVNGDNPVGDAKDPVDSKRVDMVPLEAHRKLLDEKKKAQAELAEKNAKLAEFEAAKAAAEEAKLAAEKKWEELALLKQKELEDAKKESKKKDEILEAARREREEEKKREEVMKELGEFKKPQYMKFLNIEEIPDDLAERKLWIEKFRVDNSDLLVPRNVTPPPGTAPRSNGSVSVKPKTMQEHREALRKYNAEKFGKK